MEAVFLFGLQWNILPTCSGSAMLYPTEGRATGIPLLYPETLSSLKQSYLLRTVLGGIWVSRGWLVFMWAVIGAVVGQLIGAALNEQVPLLNFGLSLGFDPTNLDLAFMQVTLGVKLTLSIAGAMGLVLALWLALRN
jgi:hypothetical protein